VRRGDIWAADWAGYQLVYLFQRPESMQRALAKAQAEMAAGAWLVSLEFAVPGEQPQAELKLTGDRSVWLYRITRREKPHAAATEMVQAAVKGHRSRRYFGR
ncbi:MAG: hypothetical protein ACTS5V_08855, partial [Giesbergeria sp.]